MSTLILVFHPHLKDGSRVNAACSPNSPHRARTTSSCATNTPNTRTSPSTPTQSTRLLEAADRVILQFPFYWYSSPALLKEWEDEVITAGWAYAGAHALKGKELKLVVTTGSDAAKYRKDGEYSHTMEELLSRLRSWRTRSA